MDTSRRFSGGGHHTGRPPNARERVRWGEVSGTARFRHPLPCSLQPDLLDPALDAGAIQALALDLEDGPDVTDLAL